MTVGIWILGDQLWQGQAALASRADQPGKTPVILIESLAHVQTRPYHVQKLVLVWSAMRHFAEVLKQRGWPVTYQRAADFETPLQAWINQMGITELWVMAPADRPFARFLAALDLPCPLQIVPNNHFLWSVEDFATWASNRKSLRLESFYRESRKRFDILMEGNNPVGGQWNFDQANRKPPKANLQPPAPLTFEPDEITQTVMTLVEQADFPTFGELASFGWAVTREQALQVLETFITERLPTFGPYQDAMITGEDTLWHALISPYLNLGLLHPLEVLKAVEAAYEANDLPLNCVEGFIRQVLGWREYMRGIYHRVAAEDCDLVSADWSVLNHFQHTHPLPNFFWTANTPVHCLHQTLEQVKRTGYAHHIQRLMILSNFALIAGLSPQAVENWFHATFIDAYDWVMQPNVIGMGLFADGGLLATKPYAASANYINRMSDYCNHCQYDPKRRTGETACPFNVFYWDFLDRHRDTLQSQGRMAFILKNLDKMSPDERSAIHHQAQSWHQANGQTEPGP
jgi:deoxyribodipyrimidine photolyase-related protein